MAQISLLQQVLGIGKNAEILSFPGFPGSNNERVRIPHEIADSRERILLTAADCAFNATEVMIGLPIRQDNSPVGEAAMHGAADTGGNVTPITHNLSSEQIIDRDKQLADRFDSRADAAKRATASAVSISAIDHIAKAGDRIQGKAA